MLKNFSRQGSSKLSWYGFLHLYLYFSQLPHLTINIHNFILKKLENDYIYKIIYCFVFFSFFFYKSCKMHLQNTPWSVLKTQSNVPPAYEKKRAFSDAKSKLTQFVFLTSICAAVMTSL